MNFVTFWRNCELWVSSRQFLAYAVNVWLSSAFGVPVKVWLSSVFGEPLNVWISSIFGVPVNVRISSVFDVPVIVWFRQFLASL